MKCPARGADTFDRVGGPEHLHAGPSLASVAPSASPSHPVPRQPRDFCFQRPKNLTGPSFGGAGFFSQSGSFQ